jgi:VanZ family protein
VRFLKHLRWALLWALVIFILCVLPGKDIPSFWWTDLLSIDKLVHAGVFGVLVLLLSRGLRAHYGGLELRSRRMLLWILACIAYGGALEIMQGVFLTDRYADVLDFLANSAGCGLAWWWLDRKARVARA